MEVMRNKLMNHNSALDATVESILPGIQQQMAATETSVKELTAAVVSGFENQDAKLGEVTTSLQRMEALSDENKRATVAVCLQIAPQVLGKNIRVSLEEGGSNDDSGSHTVASG